MIALISKIYHLVIFELKRTIGSLFILIIIPVSLLVIGIMYQYFLTTLLTPSSPSYNFRLFTKLFKYLQQFISSIYSIIIGSYLFYDKSVLIFIQVSENRYIPYISKFLTVLLINSILSEYFILLYVIFCLIFVQIPPNISIVLSLSTLTLFEIFCFTSLTFIGFVLFYRFHLGVQLSFLFPVVLLFIFPSFIYSGIAYGVFPDFINSFTIQHNLTMISNYILPTIDNMRPELGKIIPSLIFCSTSTITAITGGFLLIKDFEY